MTEGTRDNKNKQIRKRNGGRSNNPIQLSYKRRETGRGLLGGPFNQRLRRLGTRRSSFNWGQQARADGKVRVQNARTKHQYALKISVHATGNMLAAVVASQTGGTEGKLQERDE
ncbi:uncharacterized protein N7458_009837 [Penicillium daleae]|uniref:Uncharacterized protein n=1 Tax=Penicillium daleae TaxID=63821 RepID=A0AAD6FZB9_9EURO|nr:uncharacterized protein N7458_009837 [Penicillium daleae]KAJ5438839.1 hypothetical protein N7458_009837 [Penicillium daleae]